MRRRTFITSLLALPVVATAARFVGVPVEAAPKLEQGLSTAPTLKDDIFTGEPLFKKAKSAPTFVGFAEYDIAAGDFGIVIIEGNIQTVFGHRTLTLTGGIYNPSFKRTVAARVYALRDIKASTFAMSDDCVRVAW